MDEDMGKQADELAARIALCPQDLRDWAEGLGYLNMRQRIDSAAAIAGQANSTLTLLLAGLAGTLNWAVQVLQPQASAVAWGALAVAGYLVVLITATVHAGINLRDAPAVYNRPGNLMIPGVTLEQVRMGELANLDARIQQQIAIINQRAAALNAVRLAACAAPLVFGLAAAWAAWR